MDFIIPGQAEMIMSIKAFVKIAEYVLDHKANFKPRDHFTITGSDGKKLKIKLIE